MKKFTFQNSIFRQAALLLLAFVLLFSSFRVSAEETAPSETPADESPAAENPEWQIPIGAVWLKYPEMTYTGKPRTQTKGMIVTADIHGETVLLENKKDYTVSYRNNTGLGTATITVTGKGLYTGSIQNTFEIVPKRNEILISGDNGTRTIQVNHPDPACTDPCLWIWSERNDMDDLQIITPELSDDGSLITTIFLSDFGNSGKWFFRFCDGDAMLSQVSAKISDKEYYLQKYLTGSDSDIDYVQWAISLANDDSIGYGHEWPATISCSGLVSLSLTYCGYGDMTKPDVKGWGYTCLGSYFEQKLAAIGFKRTDRKIDRKHYKFLKPGDILYYYRNGSCHTGIYIGNGKTVEARGSSQTTNADDNGVEIAIYSFKKKSEAISFDTYFRLPKSKIHFR